jgi:hypothetical protein
MNTQCGQNVKLLNVKRGGTYSNHCALKVKVLKELNRKCVYVQYIVKRIQRNESLAAECKIKENLSSFLSRILVTRNVFQCTAYHSWTMSNSTEGNLGTDITV